MSSPKTLNQWVSQYRNFDFTADQIENSQCPSWDNACKELKSILMKTGKKYGFEVENFISNWYEALWFLKDNQGQYVYCHISDVRHWDNALRDILIRTAKSAEDYHGGTNEGCVLSTSDADDFSYSRKWIFDKANELLGHPYKHSRGGRN